MSTLNTIVDSQSFRSRAAGMAAELGAIAIQNIDGVLMVVDDQGAATPLIGSAIVVTSGPVDGDGSAGDPITLAASGVTAGSYTNATITVDAYGRVTVAASGSASSYTFSTGLTNSSGTVTADLSTGKAGGQTAYGSTLTGENLTLRPNAADTTTGKVYIGTGTASTSAVWDQATQSLNLGGVTPSSNYPFQYAKSVNATTQFRWQNTSSGTSVSNGIVVVNDLGLGLNLLVNSSGGTAGAGALAAVNGSIVYSSRSLVLQSGSTSPIILSVADGTEAMRIASDGTTTATGRIQPAADDTYQLGSSTKAWNAIWVNTLARTGVSALVEFNVGQGIQIDSNTTGNIQLTHQGTNGRFITDATGIAFFQIVGGSPVGVAQQASGGNLTNNVTSGGTTDTIANYTDLTIYANDAAAIRNNFYQIARKLKQVNDGLRAYALLN